MTGGEPQQSERVPALVEQFKGGLAAPICLTWEWTYACNLACAHCLSSSGRRDPDELTTGEMMSVVDELRAMQVFYVNVGGGEPTVRPDFWELLDYAVARQVGVKFSTNGLRLDAGRARRLAGTDYVDVQISLDGASRQVNDAVRGGNTSASVMGSVYAGGGSCIGPSVTMGYRAGGHLAGKESRDIGTVVGQ